MPAGREKYSLTSDLKEVSTGSHDFVFFSPVKAAIQGKLTV